MIINPLPRVIAFFVLLSLCVLSFADAKGTYSAQVNLPDTVSSGKLEYKLELKDHRDARLEIKRTSRLHIDRDTIDKYGDQLTFLESPTSVSLTGSWSETNDGIRLEFDRIRSSEDSDKRDLTVELYADGEGYRVDSWDTSFFGEVSQPRFKKINRNNGNDLAAGLAIVAAGALIMANNSSDRSSGDEFRVETGGNGFIRFGNGDRSDLYRVQINLRRGSSATVTLNGSYRVEFKGSWRSTYSGYRVRIEEIKIGNSRRRASGDLYIDRDSDRDRKRARSLYSSFRIDSDEWRNGSFNFRCNRG